MEVMREIRVESFLLCHKGFIHFKSGNSKDVAFPPRGQCAEPAIMESPHP